MYFLFGWVFGEGGEYFYGGVNVRHLFGGVFAWAARVVASIGVAVGIEWVVAGADDVSHVVALLRLRYVLW